MLTFCLHYAYNAYSCMCVCFLFFNLICSNHFKIMSGYLVSIGVVHINFA